MEYVATFAGVVGAVAAALACVWARKALAVSREANRLARDNNEVARRSFDIDKRQHDIDELSALKQKRFQEFWPLVQAMTSYKVPSTTDELAEEWEGRIKNLANETRIQWKNLDPRDPPSQLPAAPAEIKAICNEFFQRAGWPLIQ